MLKARLSALPLRFKTARQRREFDSTNVRPELVWMVSFLALWIFWRHRRIPEITEIYRTDEEQRALYPDEPGRKSVHQFWRGCDMVVRELGAAAHRDICDAANKLFPYGKPGYQTCIYHNAGTGWHLHLQVRD